MPVAERRVLQPELCLAVALFEELLDAPRRPLPVHVPPLGRVRDVAGVEQETEHLRLVEAEKNEMGKTGLNWLVLRKSLHLEMV